MVPASTPTFTPNFLIGTTEQAERAHALLSAHLSKFGYEYGSFAIIAPPSHTTYGMTTLPEEWLNFYFQNDLFKADPAATIPMVTQIPVDWRVAKELDTIGFFPLFESRGLGNHGFTIPLKGRYGDYSMLFCSVNCSEEEWEKDFVSRKPELIEETSKLHSTAIEIFEIRRHLIDESLSDRERSILAHLAGGASMRETAEALSLSNRTVETHVTKVRSKLAARNTTHAIARAVKMGLIDPV